MSTHSPVLTVVIPTYNPRREILARVLAALRVQTLPATDWETILVDNASAPAVTETWVREQLPAVTVVQEPRAGLAFARAAGITRSRGDWLVFVDDDNVLDGDYLRNAMACVREHPRVGVAGGRIVGEFLVPPPRWAQSHLQSLALRDLGDTTLFSDHRGNVASYDYFAPYGAGMVVRRDIAQAFVELVAQGAHSVGRRGGHLGGCEDCELVLLALRRGRECGYFPQLVVRHVIPQARLRFSYLQRLARQGQESWAEFLARHGMARSIPRWSVPLRQIKASFETLPLTRRRFIEWRARCGYFAGLARTGA